ncbi:hypothetical protein F2Q69_00016540 [Brassica cretica]|uniref:Reticulon-like protein n=1 Tax=Brassica cretica TaxID=69181 RepID=A0A8S9R2I2_BRACR|nr:hypothetical protein F2Q69_00016540 [Brassica cretica]
MVVSDDDKNKKSSNSPSAVESKAYGLFGREKHVHKVLGRGKHIEPATDIFMWKNKKMSGGVLGGATAAWVLLELMEYHLN